jgi:hypothetical protein
VVDVGFQSAQMDDVYRRFLEIARLNVADLIVEAVTSRMAPVGFQTRADDVDGDKACWEKFQANHLDVGVREVFRDMAVYGQGLALVDPDDGSIQALDPHLAAVEDTPGRPWEARAAVFAGRDDVAGVDEIILVWHDADTGQVLMRRAVNPSKTSVIPSNGRVWRPSWKAWDWADDPVELSLPVVPVVPFTAKDGLGQFERHLASLDRINHTIFQRLVITVMQAFKQRWIAGDLPATYPDDDPSGLGGQPVPYDQIFKTGPTALWMLPEGTKIQESSTTDINPLLTAVKDDLRQLAGVSQTPLYILDPEAAMGSAAGASASRETLVFKVEDMQARAGDSLRTVMELAFQASGAPKQILKTMWAPPDRVGLAEKAQAASQAASSLPKRTIWREIWQYTPDQIEQAEQDMAEEAFEQVQQTAELTDAQSPTDR